MCWTGDDTAVRKIAKRDFYVYKIGRVSDKGFNSLYQNFIYIPGVLNEKVKIRPIIHNYSIHKLLEEQYGVIYEGYHSYLTEEIAKGRMYSAEIGIFEIPVGATVYINYAYREVVSTDIKYLGLLEE